jgi:hypothetical protein
MAIAAFAMMTKTLLSVLGQEGLLRGTVACQVNIEHGVQIAGPDGMTVLERSVATIPVTANPTVGETLTHPDGNYRLDVETGNNGYTKRFILLPVVI